MRILIVDDEGNIRRSLQALLAHEGYRINEAASAEEALRMVDDVRPDVVLLDLMLPGMSGLDALPRLREIVPEAAVVMMSGAASLDDAVQATRLGAFHFIEKPLSPEAVLLTIRGAAEVSRARDLSRALIEELGPATGLIGETEVMRELRETLRKVAASDARVLILGESGTGKELAAAAIHALSQRSAGPFVRVNSAAIPRDLVESEMFGHERGAFTGATERRRGRFELAHGGTLFLDEVGDLGPEAQAKLLRAIDTGRVERVGASDSIDVDVRLIAATNRDLDRATSQGEFRSDLLYRLSVIPLRMPALRARRDDLPLLVQHAQSRLCARQGLAPVTFSDGAIERLLEHDWPGNVRELFNVVERLTILRSGPTVDADAVDAILAGARQRGVDTPVDAAIDRGVALSTRLERFERQLIEQALAEAGDNVAEAARILQTDRANLYRRMKRLGLRDL
jgi:two-component system nitrogen regulation response regulator NtrX